MSKVAPHSSVIEVTDTNSTVLTRGIVVADFYATWCGPCKRLSPHFTRFADAGSPSIVFAKIDSDENAELVEKYDIKGLPTVLLMREGAIVTTAEGCDESDLANLVDKALALAKK